MVLKIKFTIILLGLFILLIFVGNSFADLDFEEDFESGSLQNLNQEWTSIAIASLKAVELVTTPTRNGNWAIKFNIFDGQSFVNEGVRAEITYDNGDAQGSEKWYAWSFLVSDEYKNSSPGLWQAMGQFHDQPNMDKGETWKNWSGTGHSPSVAIYYVSVDVENIPMEYHITVPNFWSYVADGIFSAILISVGVGEDSSTIAAVPLIRGTWTDVMFHIKWSMSNDGFVEFYNNNQFVIRKDGRNMWNDYPHKLDLGLYRSPDIHNDNSVYYDEVRVGDTQQDVDVNLYATAPSEF